MEYIWILLLILVIIVAFILVYYVQNLNTARKITGGSGIIDVLYKKLSDSLKNGDRDTSKFIQDCLNKIEELNKTIADYTLKSATQLQELVMANKKLVEQDSKIVDMMFSIENYKKQIEILNGINKNLQNHSNELSEKYKDNVEKLSLKSTVLEKTINDNNKLIDKKKREIKELEEHLNTCKEENFSLETTIKNIKAELNSTKKEAEKAVTKLQETQEKYANYVDPNTVKEYETKLKKHIIEIGQLKLDINNKNKIMEDQDIKISELSKKEVTLINTVKSLYEQKEILEVNVLNLNNKNQQLEPLIEQLQSEISSVNTQLTNVNNEKNKITTELNILKSNSASLLNDNNVLQNKLKICTDTLQKEIENKQKIINELNQCKLLYDEVNKRLNQSTSNYNDLNNLLLLEKNKVLNILNQLNQTNNSLTEKEQELLGARKLQQLLSETIQKITTKCQECDEKLKAKSDENQILIQQKNQLENQLQIINNKLLIQTDLANKQPDIIRVPGSGDDTVVIKYDYSPLEKKIFQMNKNPQLYTKLVEIMYKYLSKLKPEYANQNNKEKTIKEFLDKHGYTGDLARSYVDYRRTPNSLNLVRPEDLVGLSI